MPAIAFTSIYPDGPGSEAAGGAAQADAAGNPLYPGMPAGATPVERDVSIAAAGTWPVWTPSANKRFVLVSAFLSTDTAMRVALVDDQDVQGQRPVVARFGANGGASPNLLPAPYVGKSAGNVLRAVTSALGNVEVSVRGWEQDA